MGLIYFFTKGVIGFTYGVSFPLTVVMLDYWLKDCGVSNTTIGLFTVFHIPFVLKLFFAPLIDNYDIPYLSDRFGQRRSWVIVSQLMLIISVLCMANVDPKNNLATLMLFAVMVAIADGFQNIALFPYQISDINDDNRGYVASIVSFGHRLGMIATKCVVLYVAHFVSWKAAYEYSALLICICMISVMNIKNPEIQGSKITDKPSSNLHGVLTKKSRYSHLSIFKDLGLQFRNIYNSKYGGYTFWIIILYKAADFFIHKMSRSFCIELGFSKLEIAHIVQVFGSVSVIFGGIISGFIIKKYGIIKAMFYLCFIHMIFLFSYLLLCCFGNNTNVLCSVIFLEGISGGAVSTAFIAFLYDLCTTGSQYAIVWAIHEVSGMIFSALSGICADTLDWSLFFVVTPLISIPVLLLLVKLNAKKNRGM